MPRYRSKIFLVLLLMMAPWAVLAEDAPPQPDWSQMQPNDPVVIQLNSKELIVGTFVRLEADTVIVQSEKLGEIHVPLKDITKAERGKENLEVQSDVKKLPPKRIWSFHVDAGIKGSEGNSQTLSVRGAAGAARTTEKNRLKIEGSYTLDYGQNSITKQREKTGNKGNFDVRDEMPLPFYPRLNAFVDGAYNYDAFRECEQRGAGHAGVGYDIIKTATILLGAHGGAGVSREFGCPGQELTPEGVVGANFEYTPVKLQKISLSADVFPDLRDLGEFRSVEKALWMFFLTNGKNLNISLGAEHRYDSTPGISKPHDVDYFASLGFLF